MPNKSLLLRQASPIFQESTREYNSHSEGFLWIFTPENSNSCVLGVWHTRGEYMEEYISRRFFTGYVICIEYDGLLLLLVAPSLCQLFLPKNTQFLSKTFHHHLILMFFYWRVVRSLTEVILIGCAFRLFLKSILDNHAFFFCTLVLSIRGAGCFLLAPW